MVGGQRVSALIKNGDVKEFNLQFNVILFLILKESCFSMHAVVIKEDEILGVGEINLIVLLN